MHSGRRGRRYEDEVFTGATGESLGGIPSFCPYNPNPIQFLPRGFRFVFLFCSVDNFRSVNSGLGVEFGCDPKLI